MVQLADALVGCHVTSTYNEYVVSKAPQGHFYDGARQIMFHSEFQSVN